MITKYGITRTQWFAIYYIQTENEINQKLLASRLGFAEASIVSLLNKLQAMK